MQTLVPESRIARFFFTNKNMAAVWLFVRIYLGYEWLMAGYEKVINPAWVGDKAGAAVAGFLNSALKKTAEFCPPAPAACHPDVQGWYAYFVEHFALQHTALFSYMVTFGEILVGLALIAGCVVGIAAFFGVIMNMSFLLAGTVSVNPEMLVLGILLMASWRIAGYWGLDRFVLPKLFSRMNT